MRKRRQNEVRRLMCIVRKMSPTGRSGKVDDQSAASGVMFIKGG